MEDELSAIFGGRKIVLRIPAGLSTYFRDDVIKIAKSVMEHNDKVNILLAIDAAE